MRRAHRITIVGAALAIAILVTVAVTTDSQGLGQHRLVALEASEPIVVSPLPAASEVTATAHPDETLGWKVPGRFQVQHSCGSLRNFRNWNLIREPPGALTRTIRLGLVPGRPTRG
jgi:hypothetical protein